MLVPIPFVLLAVPVAVPYLFCRAVQAFPKCPTWIWSLAALTLDFFASTTLECSDISINLMIQGIFCFYFGVRYLELATLDSALVSKWTFAQFREFMLTSDNAALRSDAKTQDSKRLLRCHRNLVRNMDSQFWRRILSDLTVKYCVFATCKGYFTMHPYNYEGMFVSPFDWPAMKQHIIYAVLSYCGIDIAYNAVFLPLFIICKTPYVPTFDRPLTSSTLKEFWSTRWNKPIKNSLHRGIFSPLLTGLNARFPAWPRTRHVALAVAATFTASGLIHDYLFATMASNDAPGSQLVFFGGQGLLAAMQWEFVCAMQGTSLGRELVNGPLGKIVGWVISMLSIVIMLPAYCGGMARRGSALHIPVPTAFLDQVQAYM